MDVESKPGSGWKSDTTAGPRPVIDAGGRRSPRALQHAARAVARVALQQHTQFHQSAWLWIDRQPPTGRGLSGASIQYGPKRQRVEGAVPRANRAAHAR